MSHVPRAAWMLGSSLLVTNLLALLPAALAAAPRHGRVFIEHVVEDGGSGTFRCAWRHRLVKGLCKVSHQKIRTLDPDLVGEYGNGKSPSMLDVIVIRWPSGKVMRLIEGDDWEWEDLEEPEVAYHSAYYWDGKDVDWSRGFVILGGDWKEAIRVW